MTHNTQHQWHFPESSHHHHHHHQESHTISRWREPYTNMGVKDHQREVGGSGKDRGGDWMDRQRLYWFCCCTSAPKASTVHKLKDRVASHYHILKKTGKRRRRWEEEGAIFCSRLSIERKPSGSVSHSLLLFKKLRNLLHKEKNMALFVKKRNHVTILLLLLLLIIMSAPGLHIALLFFILYI